MNITRDELNRILREHTEWLSGGSKATRIGECDWKGNLLRVTQ